MPTLKDVAAKAGVSMSTAGAAMRGESIVRPDTKERVLAAAKELGYSPNLSARYLKKGRTGAIAVMVPSVLHPYYTRLVAAVSTEAAKHGMRTVIQETGYTSDSETSVLQAIGSTLCDGLILNASNVDDGQLHELLGNRPAVLLNYRSDHPLFDSVRPPIGNRAMGFGYLGGRGYARVAVVGAHPVTPDPNGGDVSGQDNGIRIVLDLLKGNGMGDEHDLFGAGWSIGGGMDAARALTAPGDDGTRPVDRYDAIYCMNDLIAYGLIRGLHDVGVRVPEDVAVFGNDGILPEGFTIPTLSTVATDFEDLAVKAVGMLLTRIDDPKRRDGVRTETVDCRLVVGESA